VPMPNRDAFRFFKDTFHAKIQPVISGTPFTLDLLAAIAAQETGHIWGSLHDTLDLNTLLAICVGDTLDADKGRRAFPKTKADLIAVPRGQEMFDIAHEALVQMASHVPAFLAVSKRPNKFCHGFGIFQLDLQFFKTDPDHFLEKRWFSFDVCLDKCVAELRAAQKRAGLGGRSSLTDLERVHVAIAYNAGSFVASKGLKQGHKNSEGKFYGELMFDFLRLAQTVPVGASPSPLPAPAPGNAPVAHPTPVTSTGDLFEVDVRDSPLRLRSEPKIDDDRPTSNVIAHLPDGHRVRLVTAVKKNGFHEVETSLSGAFFRGFASAKFLVPVAEDGRESARAAVPVVVPATVAPRSGVVEVHAPRRPGHITKRTATAGAHSLNETNQPKRVGTTPEELREELAAIVDYLDVEKASHVRYQPTDRATFCNIYAHDYCHLAGVYLPRVWWTQDAIERLARGETVEPKLGGTITEQRANALFEWLNAFGPRFGWRRTGTLTKLQTEVNIGAVGMIIAKRRVDGLSGHVTMVVPETGDHRARRDRGGEVIAPLQSQAGARNFRRGTSTVNWWLAEKFSDSAFWIHS
jgi:hypothetical protein